MTVSDLAKRHDIDRFRRVVRSRFGFSFEGTGQSHLAEVLARRVAAAQMEPQDYLEALERGAARSELQSLAEELTVNETYFFRNAEQLRAFEAVAVATCAREQRPLRVLSAGCASGEEPYSLAITALGTLPPEQFSIHAIDVSPSMLERARRARYAAWSLRDTPPEIRARWFSVEGREMALVPAARARVTFEEQNLVAPRAGLFVESAFDVIFCRNVLMYFDRAMAREVLRRFATSLVPGGYLFLGHAENLRGMSDDFTLRHSHSTFYYRRIGAGESADVWALPEEPRAPSGAPEAAVEAAVEADDARPQWAEAIHRASERIDVLADARMPTDTKPAPRPPWDMRHILELLGHERFSEAWAAFEQRPAEAANDPDVLLLGAVLCTNRGDLVQAERLCRDLLRIDGSNAGAHYLCALCREGSGDRSAAREHDRLALRLDPRFAMPQLHLGLLARRSGELAQACRELALARTLLQAEDAARVLMFGGGFTRSALLRLCEAELRACGGAR